MLLVLINNDEIAYEEFEGDFNPPGYAPVCPSCEGKRTFFSMLLYPYFNQSSWQCTDCGEIFGLRLIW